jgi:N-acetylmuramoyl-L-alanine amidase
MGTGRAVAAACTITAALVVAIDAQQPSRAIDAAELKAAIERGLAAVPRGFEGLASPAQAGVRLRDVRVDRVSPSSQRVTIDLSQKALTFDPAGDAELVTDQVIRSTASLTAGAGDVHYQFLVDGLPLDMFVPRADPLSFGTAAEPRGAAHAVGAPRAVVSGGHGWYWNEHYGDWHLQRNHFWGIVEDVVNWELASDVQSALRPTRFDARLARNPDPHSPPGPSGRPGWQEGAVYFIKGMGAPGEVWNIGVSDYARDINSRPLYANWIGADLVVSIHNNGGGGTGTETWFDETNGHQDESRRLAEALNTHVVRAIRRFYQTDWPDRGLRSCNGCKGENRLASSPAVILEIAFMDMKSPDNAALHDPAFKRIVAYAIRDGLHAWAGLPLPSEDQ